MTNDSVVSALLQKRTERIDRIIIGRTKMEQLKAFQRVLIPKEARKSVTLSLVVFELACWDQTAKRDEVEAVTTGRKRMHSPHYLALTEHANNLSLPKIMAEQTPPWWFAIHFPESATRRTSNVRPEKS